MFDDEVEKDVYAKKRSPRELKDVTDSFTKIMMKKKKKENKELQAKLNVILQRGLRELREKNYFRALKEFNLARMLDPDNPRAEFYIRKTEQSLDDEIKSNMLKARNDLDALKYNSAIVQYCSVVRLLEGKLAEDEPRLKKAKEQLNLVEKLMGLEKDEIKCISE